jgi:hypothetical protein
MSVIQPLISDLTENEQRNVANNQNTWRWVRTLLNRTTIINMLNSSIELNHSLLERLVIVDDSIITYNAYKSKLSDFKI